MSRPKKRWVLSAQEIADKQKQAENKIPINDRKNMLPTFYVRIVVDGEGYYVSGFKESDWEAL